MKNKNKLKLILDAVMTIAMVMLYKKNSISLMFHEVVGIAAIVIMLVHLSINLLWVKGITPKFFSKNLTGRVRVSYIINLLMLIDVIVLAISSVLVSKKIFTFTTNPKWNPIHFCSAQILITLIGLHLGLHFTYIAKTLSAKKTDGNGEVTSEKKNRKIGKIIFITVFSLIAIFGLYSIFKSNYLSQISMPFKTLVSNSASDKPQMTGEGFHGQPGHGGGGMQKGMNGGHPMAQFSASALAKTVSETASIIIFFAMISYLLDELVLSMRKKRALPSPKTLP